MSGLVSVMQDKVVSIQVRQLSQTILRFALMSLLVLMQACVKPQQKTADPDNDFATTGEVENESASYYITEIKGESLVSKTFPGFSIPTEKQYTFSTKVYNKRTRDLIKGHKFVIRGGVKDVEVRSDEDGVVRWTESVPFVFTSDVKYIPLDRVLEANGVHKGSRRLTIGIAPWLSGSAEVRDLAKNPAPEVQVAKRVEVSNLLIGRKGNGEEYSKHLWIDDLRIVTTPDYSEQDAVVSLNVSLSPKILTTDLNGTTDPYTLKDGTFSGRFWLIGRAADNSCTVISKTGTLDKLTMVGGRIREMTQIPMKFQVVYGRYELVGSISAKNGPSTLLPFEGQWMIGDHSQLTGMKFAELLKPAYNNIDSKLPSGERFTAENYIKGCVDASEPSMSDSQLADRIGQKTRVLMNAPGAVQGAPPVVSRYADIPSDLDDPSCIRPADMPRLFPGDPVALRLQSARDVLTCTNADLPSGVSRLEKFEISLVKSFTTVIQAPILDPVEDETSVERKVRFFVTPTITNPMANGAPVRDMVFNIEHDDGTVQKNQRTQTDGTLKISGFIQHKYFEPERFYLRSFKITNSAGYSKRLVVVFNPWDQKGVTFGRDIRYLTKKEVAEVNLVKRPLSEIIMVTLNWGTQRFRYEIDDHLNLQVFKTYNVVLSPRVVRYSSLVDGRNSREDLRDGVYLLKIALQKDYEIGRQKKRLEYITAVKRLVRVKAGIISTPVEMGFRDMRILKVRSNLLVELAPVDESKLPIEVTEIHEPNTTKIIQKRQRALNTEKPLDSLVAHGYGLAPRTFVGPVVAYSNGFTTTLRPTDELDEKRCGTIDCDELKKEIAAWKNTYKDISKKAKDPNEAETKRIEGDIEHLYNISASDIIERFVKQEKKYHETMNALGTMNEFLKIANYEYVGLRGGVQRPQENQGVIVTNQVYKNGFSFKEFAEHLAGPEAISRIGKARVYSASPYGAIDRIARSAANGFSKQDLQAWVSELFDTERPSTGSLTLICPLILDDLVLRPTAEQKERIDRGRLYQKCMTGAALSAQGNGRGGSLYIEKRLRTLDVESYKRLGGNLWYVSVGTGVGYDVGESSSMSWSPINAIGGIMKVLSTLAPWTRALGFASMAKPFSPFGLAEKVIDATGVSMSFGQGEGKGAGANFGVGNSVAVELRAMQVKVKNFERCVGVRLSARFIQENFDELARELASQVKTDELGKRLSRGLLFCDGVMTDRPIHIAENYYQFSQSIGEEAMNDVGALENHPYLLSVRGQNDYARFLKVIQAIPAKTQPSLKPFMREAGQVADDKDVKEPSTWERLGGSMGDDQINALVKAFEGASPSLSGFYDVIGKFPEPDKK